MEAAINLNLLAKVLVEMVEESQEYKNKHGSNHGTKHRHVIRLQPTLVGHEQTGHLEATQ